MLARQCGRCWPSLNGETLTPALLPERRGGSICPRARARAERPGERGYSRWRTPEVAEQIRAGTWKATPYEDAGTATQIDPRTLSAALDDLLPEERTLAVDSGHFMGYPPMYLRVPDPEGFVFTQAFQAVGLGLASAIGAAVARPDRLTVAALGDGGAMMALPELETVARLGLRMLIVVYNDAAYGAEVHHFGPMGHPVELVQFPDVDFAALGTGGRPGGRHDPPTRRPGASSRRGSPARGSPACSWTRRSCRPSSPSGWRRRSGGTDDPVPTLPPGRDMRTLLMGWRYAEVGRRDLRLDFLRGYAVFAMVCDHVAGISWFSPFTGGNRFVTSAAEGFVLLAGLVLGMVYGPRIARDGWLAAADPILRRAAVLYGVTVGLTLVFVGLFQFTELRLWLDRAYGLGLTDPVELVVGTLTLHFVYHGTDILLLYCVLIAVSPLLLLALSRGRWPLVLAGSWLVWLAHQFYPAQVTIPWTVTNAYYFPVAGWQVIFVSALIVGFYHEQVARFLGKLPVGAWLAIFAVGLAVLIVIQRAHDTGRLAAWPILGPLAGDLYYQVFDKRAVALGRLVASVDRGRVHLRPGDGLLGAAAARPRLAPAAARLQLAARVRHPPAHHRGGLQRRAAGGPLRSVAHR